MRMPFILTAAAFCVVGSTIALAALPMAPVVEADPLPAVQFVGHDSRITKPRFVLITTEADWNQMWWEHAGIDNPHMPPTRHRVPKVDFSKYMIVGVFAGASINTDGQIASAVVSGPDALRVRYERSTFQTSSGLGGGKGGGMDTAPYGLWVVERSEKTVILEEGRRDSGLKANPITWKEVHRFARP